MSHQSLPLKITLHKQRRTLELQYADAESLELDAEYLRVFSPSAEVRGHGSGQETLQTGKKQVAITKVQAIGNYALQLFFDDGHNTGIYSWNYLVSLHHDREDNWREYLEQLSRAGASREPGVQVLRL